MNGIDTLRVSVTDRCNLRCVYCLPAEGIANLPHEEILRFEEIARIVAAAVALGVKKVRLTGGEPLMRRELPKLVAMLSSIKGLQDLPLTTNGVLLAKYAEDLKDAGLTRVTISLDTLRRARFKKIARKDALHLVLKGVDRALDVGLKPVKINTVIVPGENDDEILDFAKLALGRDIEVRFIERMPIPVEAGGQGCGWLSREYMPSPKVKQLIENKYGPLQPRTPEVGLNGPAVTYALGQGSGRIGFISPMSEPFCQNCGRMRLTAEGRLRPCLVEETEVDIKGPLRRGAGDEELKEIIITAIKWKPLRRAAHFARMNRRMSQIGG